MQNGRCKVTQTQRAILSHVFQHNDGHDVGAELKSHVVQCIAQSFGPQNARLFLGVHFENALPCLQVSNEGFELQEVDSAVSSFLKDKKLLLDH